MECVCVWGGRGEVTPGHNQGQPEPFHRRSWRMAMSGRGCCPATPSMLVRLVNMHQASPAGSLGTGG